MIGFYSMKKKYIWKTRSIQDCLLLSLFVISAVFAQRTDITFFITSDTHYGVGDDEAIPANRTVIDLMNAMPQTAYPDAVGGTVDRPRGVVVTGDLTQDARREEWDWFAADYGVNGEGRVQFPVYESWGNHDQHGSDVTAVTRGIAARNQSRPGLSNLSENGYHYAWDWDGVHFVQLNIYPGSGSGDPNSWGCPHDSLEFLQKDLSAAVGGSGRPVVLFCHFAFDGWGLTNWSAAEQEAFYQAVAPYKDNIIALFGGHGHAALEGTWNGIPYYEVSATQPTTDDNGFTVVNITDSRLVVATYRSADQTWNPVFQKPLKLPALESVQTEAN